ncbi:FGGY carbohydrate kinase domain-containing protein-like [Trifolium medium]|uniref:FGGY carbohydrate kinase domain-containing protein-like n=1 Tax=Trifolium medium TaxID=97028 RepID=A0A392MTT4_9FABA|nr:FGGY carbohydrate kinase domain-containing protein-like [Trifolium medium]
MPGIPVGTSLIDAHAGGVGVIESVPPSEAEEHDKEAICNRMVLVCGTSTCHMAVSRSKLFIPGIWGPFWSGSYHGKLCSLDVNTTSVENCSFN